jgi:hypothetical protein
MIRQLRQVDGGELSISLSIKGDVGSECA